jgi:hypothetical protein
MLGILVGEDPGHPHDADHRHRIVIGAPATK